MEAVLGGHASEEKLSSRWIADRLADGSYHRCSCGSLLQKDGGCNWVKCLRCAKEWCWVTKRPKGSGPGQCPYHGPHNCH